MADSVGFLVDSRLALSAKDLRPDLSAPSVAIRTVTIRIPNRVASRYGSIRVDSEGPDEARQAVILDAVNLRRIDRLTGRAGRSYGTT
jgi:hypothetical protein